MKECYVELNILRASHPPHIRLEAKGKSCLGEGGLRHMTIICGNGFKVLLILRLLF